MTLPEGERRLTLTVPGYILRSMNYGSTDLLRDPLKLSAKDTDQLRVTLASASVTGGVPGGVIGGVLGGIIAPPPPPMPPSLPPPSAGIRIGGDVAQANLISNVPPKYPELARAARVQGIVLLDVTISREGTVENVRVVSGHALLNEAAIEAVKQWRYRPQVINGQAVQVQTTVTVNFTFQ